MGRKCWKRTQIAENYFQGQVLCANTCTEPICKSLNLQKVQDIYQLIIIQFYFKLINHELPQCFDTFTQTSLWVLTIITYKTLADSYQIIYNEFPKQSLRMLCLMKQTQIMGRNNLPVSI